MSLLHVSGNEVSLREWNLTQCYLALDFGNDTQAHLSENQVLSLWIDKFSELAREICDGYGVHLETFDRIMHEFQVRLAVHLQKLQYYEGEVEHREVKTPEALSHVEIIAQECINESQHRNGVLVKALIPSVKDEKGYMEQCFFPIYARVQNDHQMSA